MIVEGKDLINFNPPEVQAGVFKLLTENNQLPSPKFGKIGDFEVDFSVDNVDDLVDEANVIREEDRTMSIKGQEDEDEVEYF